MNLLALLAPLPIAAVQFPNPTTLPAAPGVKVSVVDGPPLYNAARDVADIGDFNGDGWPDFALGAPTLPNAGAVEAGACYIVFGGPAWSGTATLSVAGLDGSNGFVVLGEEATDQFGTSVAGAGDVNADGYDDLLVTAPGLNDAQGAPLGGAYVLLGGPSVAPTGVLLASTISAPGSSLGCVIRCSPPSDRHRPSVAGVGDVDGDGVDDILIGDIEASTDVDVYPTTSGHYPEIAVGDLDGDGDIDFVRTDASAQQYSVFTNLGNAQFAEVVYPQANMPGRVRLCDLDLDGDLDMVFQGVANSGLASLRTLRNQGYGVFSQPTTYVGDNDGLDFDIADMNGDGAPDIVRCDFRKSTSATGLMHVVVMLNDGSGVLTEFAPVSAPLRPIVVRCADLDADGDVDVAVDCRDVGAIHFYSNDGSGVLTPVGAGSAISLNATNLVLIFQLGDLNQDGFPDLVESLSKVRYATGPFSFAPPTYWSGDLFGTTTRVQIADVTGDGAPDLIGGLSSGPYPYPIGIRRSTGGGALSPNAWQFSQNGYIDYTIEVADLDGDSDLDVVRALVGHVAIVLNNGDGTFPGMFAGEAFVVRGSPSFGATDAIELGQLTPAQGFRMDGFHAGQSLGRSVAGLGDVNGDGRKDFAVSAIGEQLSGDAGSGVVYVVLGAPGLGSSGSLDLRTLNGANGFRIRDSATGGKLSYALSQPVDFDGDGFDDIVIGEREGDFGFGDRRGSAHVIFGGANVGAVGSVDLLTHDGVDKVQFLSAQNGDHVGFFDFAAGDLNGDGRGDLLLGDPTDDEGATHRGVVHVIYGAPRPYPSGTLTLPELDGVNGFRILGETADDNLGESIAVVGDLNGDGLADAVLAAPGWTGAGAEGRAYVLYGQDYGVPIAYCTAKVNSLGCVPSIGWAGALPSISSASPFFVMAIHLLNQKNGLLFYGVQGRTSSAFQGGLLCVRQPVRRTQLSNSGGTAAGLDCTGVFSLDFNGWLMASGDPALVAGVTVDAQFWSRDPASSFGVNLSDGLEFRVAP